MNLEGQQLYIIVVFSFKAAALDDTYPPDPSCLQNNGKRMEIPYKMRFSWENPRSKWWIDIELTRGPLFWVRPLQHQITIT